MDKFFAPSPMEQVTVNGFDIWLKRDDLLCLSNDKYQSIAGYLTGNKARKFYYLLGDIDSNYQRIVSYGSAQGNGLVALAAIAKIKGLRFDYYVDHISEYLLIHKHQKQHIKLILCFKINDLK